MESTPVLDVLYNFLMQLGVQAPVLLAYLLGLVLAFVYFKRYPRPCLFLLAATILLLVGRVVFTFVPIYLIHTRSNFNGDEQQLGWWLSVNAIAGSMVHALAFGLLLAAVFSGRSRPLPVQDFRKDYREAQGDKTEVIDTRFKA